MTYKSSDGCRVDAMCVNGSGTVLVCGMSGGSLSLRALWNLDELHVIDTLRVHRSITALWFTEGKRESLSEFVIDMKDCVYV